MEKKHRILLAVIALVTAGCGYLLGLDYSKIAESGLTLSSIVLAVYIAAIIGLINTPLAKKMQKAIATPQKDKTQLGVLTLYFKWAAFFSVGTILISSLILLLSKPTPATIQVLVWGWRALSILGLVFYVENIVFLVIIMRFMLNRQIWDN